MHHFNVIIVTILSHYNVIIVTILSQKRVSIESFFEQRRCFRAKLSEFSASNMQLFDPERNNSSMFEAENSLNFALKQRLRSKEK